MKDSTVATIAQIKSVHGMDTGGRWFYICMPEALINGKWKKTNALVVRNIDGIDGVAEACLGMELKVGDVIKTGPDGLIAIEFVLGGKVGINFSSAVRITSERSVADAEVSWKRIILRKGGLWAKAVHLKEPLEIKTNGGVIGIKG